jgi:SET domain-containing protein
MEIKQSKIQGLGVFATKDIKAGEKLFQYIGEEMSLTEFKTRYGEYKYNSLNTYRMKRLNRIIVAKEEPYLSTNLVNFINESLNPNCVLKKRALYALHDISVGTELTLKYPADYCRNYNLDLQS